MFFTSFQNEKNFCPEALNDIRLNELMKEKNVFNQSNYICSVFLDDLTVFNSTSKEPETYEFSGREFCIQKYKEEYCNGGDCAPFCTFWASFLEVWIMLIGEVNGSYFKSNFSVFLYISFGYMVVILLANALIAIVTAYYGVVRYKRAEIVFWSNRLDYVAQMDAIANGVSKFFLVLIGRGQNSMESFSEDGVLQRSSFSLTSNSSFGHDLWKDFLDTFETTASSNMSIDFVLILFHRLIAVIIVPIWIIVGICTAGWLWPPQIREWCFVANYTTASKGKTAETFNKNHIKHLQEVTLRNEDLVKQVKEMDVVLKSFMKFKETEHSEGEQGYSIKA